MRKILLNIVVISKSEFFEFTGITKIVSNNTSLVSNKFDGIIKAKPIEAEQQASGS